MEEGMARGEGRFFEIDAHTMDRGSKDMAAMTAFFTTSLKGLL